MSDWSQRRWIGDDMTMKAARQAERDGLGRLTMDDDPGPALWVPEEKPGVSATASTDVRQSGKSVAMRIMLAEHVLSGPKTLLIWGPHDCLKVTVERVRPDEHDAPVWFRDEAGGVSPPAASEATPQAQPGAAPDGAPDGADAPEDR